MFFNNIKTIMSLNYDKKWGNLDSDISSESENELEAAETKKEEQFPLSMPWYMEKSVQPPSKQLVPKCVDMGKKGDFATVRGSTGETQLHYAVMKGNVKKINELLNRKGKQSIYVDIPDWKMNTSLYYACTHTDIKNNDVRYEIVKLLLKHGADPCERGILSGLSSYEVVKENKKYEKIAELMEQTTFPVWSVLRKAAENRLDIPPVVAELVAIRWNSCTCTWFLHPNQINVMKGFKPNMELDPDGDLSVLEQRWVDVANRHKSWWTSVQDSSKL